MGHGALFMGHAHPEITAAVIEQAQKGTHYGANHRLELEWASWCGRSCRARKRCVSPAPARRPRSWRSAWPAPTPAGTGSSSSTNTSTAGTTRSSAHERLSPTTRTQRVCPQARPGTRSAYRRTTSRSSRKSSRQAMSRASSSNRRVHPGAHCPSATASLQHSARRRAGATPSSSSTKS